MKSPDIGCWGHFKQNYKTELVEFIERQAQMQGIMLEDDTEIFCNLQLFDQKLIYFGREAIDETIEHISELKACRPRRIHAREKGALSPGVQYGLFSQVSDH